MKFCIPIQKDKIIRKAISLIMMTKKSIDMTMDLKEELTNPLPNSYHKNLDIMSKNGIKIVRFTYGNKNDFVQIKKLHPAIETYYKGKINLYQRILIIDKSFGLFALSGTVYFTSFRPLIKCLLKYVKILE